MAGRPGTPASPYSGKPARSSRPCRFHRWQQKRHVLSPENSADSQERFAVTRAEYPDGQELFSSSNAETPDSEEIFSGGNAESTYSEEIISDCRAEPAYGEEIIGGSRAESSDNWGTKTSGTESQSGKTLDPGSFKAR